MESEVRNKRLGGILLVAGTTIGAAMLALPITTGMAGFIPTLVLFVVYWCYMTYTAFLMLETTLALGYHVNLISMAKATLGRLGEFVSWIVYLFLLYSLTTAYIAGSAPLIQAALQRVTGVTFPHWVSTLPLLLIFGYFVYKGTRSVDLINRVLMLGLVITYTAIVLLMAPYIQGAQLLHTDWRLILLAVPIAATSFGFHIIIPSLCSYMKGNIPLLKQTLLIGSLIPLLVYMLWEALTLGILPLEGEGGIYAGYAQGANGAALLASALNNGWIALFAQFFAFFAIVTSFLGVSLSLSDFLADGLKIKKTHGGRLILYLLTFIPPLLFALSDPRAFLTALEYAGAYGVVILLGLIPALMVWSGRYHKQLPTLYRAPGGKGALLVVILLSLSVVAIEIALQSGWIAS